jgi:hypothetical protein
MPCPHCGRPIPAEAFAAETGRASGVLLYVAGCRCGRTLRRATRPPPVAA